MAEKPDTYVGEKDISEDDDDVTGDDYETPSLLELGGTSMLPQTIPSPRFWHFSQLVNGNIYIGGGNIPKYKKRKTGKAQLAKIIEKFDVKKRIWQQLETKGDHHPGLTGVACASFGKYMFAYGGNNHSSIQSLNGVLSRLDLDTLTWSELSPETKSSPMRKDASGMVHFVGTSWLWCVGMQSPNSLW